MAHCEWWHYMGEASNYAAELPKRISKGRLENE